MFDNLESPKCKGYLLSVDPATKSGFALFHMDSNELIDVLAVSSKSTDTWGARVNYITSEVSTYFADYIDDIKYIIFENNKSSSPLLNGIAVAVTGCAPGAKVNERLCGISPSSWKAWIRRESGLPIAKPKGIEALALVAPEHVEICDGSDDCADAVIMGLYWLNCKKPNNW